jgi:hypothetical protein
VVDVEDVQSQYFERYVFQGLDVMKNREGEEEEEHRERGQYSQRYIQAAVELLPGAAVRAFGEMMLIVFAHLRRDSRDVVSPACQDGACNSVGASGTCHIVKDSLCKGCVRPLCHCAAHVAKSGQLSVQMQNLSYGFRFALLNPASSVKSSGRLAFSLANLPGTE